MINPKMLLSLLLNPAFTELAKHVDYVNVVDDDGDLVIIIGRYEKNPHGLPRPLMLESIKAIQKMAGGKLYVDEKGRVILSIILREPKDVGER